MRDSTLTARPEAGAGAAGARLENTTDNFSAPRILDSKWHKLEWLRSESAMRRQRICLTRPHGYNVQVRQGMTSIGYAGLMVCGSRLCPVCGPRIAARNRQDIIQAVRAWREGEGGTVLFGTFTLRHRQGQSFEELKEAISVGWHRVTGGRGWLRDRREHGVEHWVRVFEEKWSPENGWHLHIHYLVFVRPADDGGACVPPVESLLQSMFGRWRTAVVGLGLGTPVVVAQDLHEVTGEDADQVLGDYFTKQIDRNSGRSAEQIGLEMTLRDGKFSGVSLTPGELLTLAVVGDEHARRLWNEYERGMHNRRSIAWSRGLRPLVGIGDEPSDAELAEMNEEELMATVLELRHYAYKKLVSRRGRRVELLERVLRDGPEAAAAWCREQGITAVPGTFDEWGETDDGRE